jgi:uncharacterized membrane protein YdjX (TVP38/TMEM64 family)
MARRVAAGIVVAAAIAAAVYIGSDRQRLAAIVDWTRTLGAWGPVAAAMLIIPASVVCVPRWLYSVTAGFACGALWAVPAVSAGALLGSATAFFVGRALGRAWVERRAAGSRIAALDGAMTEGGFRIVALIRLSPLLPCSIASYLLGASRIGFGRFAAATALGMLPGTILYAALGSLAKDLAEVAAAGAWTGPMVAYLSAGAAVTVGLLVWLARLVRRQLRQRAAPPESTAP